MDIIVLISLLAAPQPSLQKRPKKIISGVVLAIKPYIDDYRILLVILFACLIRLINLEISYSCPKKDEFAIVNG